MPGWITECFFLFIVCSVSRSDVSEDLFQMNEDDSARTGIMIDELVTSANMYVHEPFLLFNKLSNHFVILNARSSNIVKNPYLIFRPLSFRLHDHLLQFGMSFMHSKEITSEDSQDSEPASFSSGSHTISSFPRF